MEKPGEGLFPLLTLLGLLVGDLRHTTKTYFFSTGGSSISALPSAFRTLTSMCR